MNSAGEQAGGIDRARRIYRRICGRITGGFWADFSTLPEIAFFTRDGASDCGSGGAPPDVGLRGFRDGSKIHPQIHPTMFKDIFRYGLSCLYRVPPTAAARPSQQQRQ